MNRRKFIKRSSLATAAIASGVNTPLFSGSTGNRMNTHETMSEGGRVSEKNVKNRAHARGVGANPVKVGLIGSGWYGLVIAKAALQAGGVEIMAVSDVDSEHLKSGADELEGLQGTRPRLFKDYRDLLDHPGLEAILIGTPPQWHALQFVDSCKKGLHVYCEKPLAYDVDEGKAMIAAAKKVGNIVQIGFQRRQSNAFQKAKELIEEGTTGKIRQIVAQIHYTPGKTDTVIQDPPASLDWDEWCGPAPKLPYRPSIAHRSWRLEKEYGNGHLVDWGIHHIDIIRTIMGFEAPRAIRATGSLDVLKGQITTPDTLMATLQFEGCPVVWQHRLWGAGDMDPRFNNGIFFHGDKGTLFAADERLIWRPSGRNQEEQVMEIPTPDMQERHLAEFIEAVKTKNPSLVSCTIEDAFLSTATVQLAMIAYETNSEVKWDAAEKTIQGNNEAKKLLARPYRAGYIRPGID